MSVSLRAVIGPDTRGNVARLAHAVGVSWMTAWRWTRPPDHPHYTVPRPVYWPALERATNGRWQAPWQYFSGRPPLPPERCRILFAANTSGMSAILCRAPC